MEIPSIDTTFENFSIKTAKHRHLRKFHTTWATFTIKVHNLEYFKGTDPLDVLRAIFNQFLELLVANDRKNDIFQIVITGGSDSTITPLSTRFLLGFQYSADTILDRFSNLLNSHEELNLADPFTVDVTHVRSAGESDETLAKFMQANIDNAN